MADKKANAPNPNPAELMIKHIRDGFGQLEYEILHDQPIQSEQMVTMRDGVKLRTVITRPQNMDVCPCVFTRNCYPFLEAFYAEIAKQYAMRGIGYVMQFCRGVGGSEGVWEPNVNERADGKDTVDWLCAQEWVGNVGYSGSSYLAMTGWIIADILPPKVKTMYLTLYGTDRHVSAYQDGLFRHDVLTAWAMGNAGFPIDADYVESCLYRPHARVDEALWGQPLDWYRMWVTQTNRTDAYWQTGMWKTLRDIPPKVNIPIFLGEGWYDHHLGSAIESYKLLPEECRKKSTFMIGPWNHWFETPLEGDNGKHRNNNDLARSFSWFYNILVNGETPAGNVTQYIIKGDYWAEHDTFSQADRENAVLYLSGGNNGLVWDAAAAEPGKQSYVYDPENPIFSHGGETLLRSKDKIGSLLQPEPGHRPDIISFVSEPLEDAVTVCGPIRARLYVSSNAEDTAFVVRVIQVDESGKGYYVRSGVTTLAYRGHSDKRRTYEPNEVVEINIDMWDIGWQFNKGCRIRIDIQSSDFPQYNVHSNTAGIWSEQTECRVAEQTVYFDKERPSCLELPLLKEGAGLYGKK